MWRPRLITGLAGLLLLAPALRLSPLPPASLAQTASAPCGYVEGFDFPVPDFNTERPDFGIYRARWGGRHTGIDVAFGQAGSPVRAAARGHVTYSDIEGWDTEKGVVVIQHTFPNGLQINTLYGHMEERDGYNFPPMGTCVERGDIVGAIGEPSQSRPHLHYEVRTRYRHEGGPGYTDISPLELGWLHPVDFTYLARIMIEPAYIGHFSLLEHPTLPPLRLSTGGYVFAQSARLLGLTAAGQTLWQFDTLGSITGLLELPGGRVLASTSENQVLILNNGQFETLWQSPHALASPPVRLGNAIVFVTGGQTLAAFTPEGSPLWETPPLPGRVTRHAISGDRLALGTLGGALWVVDAAGTVLAQQTYPAAALPFAAPDGGFFVLSGSTVTRLDTALSAVPLLKTPHTFTSAAVLLYDPAGTLYLYTGEGRSLYAYAPDGALKWIAYMPGSHLRPPHLSIGSGQALYVLTTDAQLLAYDTGDGRLLAQQALYNGGVDGVASARWLEVEPDNTVRFNGGFLTTITLDGLQLVGNNPG
ncbi:MAG: PQQ-binding-like beta-propeller repeat protein [Chloroflexi bacterium]|nr:PQQ-binding-like beta-propeller repeat protein [Chloroflexota bacterium]